LVVAALGDNSFSDSADNGLKEAARDYGIKYDCQQVGDDGIVNGIREAAQNGYDIVVAGYDSDRRALLEEESMDYPDTIFFLYDNGDTEWVPNDNVLAVIFKANESDFVCGAIAAKQSTSKVTGWVGGQEYTSLYDFLVGWVEGVKYADETASTAYSWVAGSSPWSDPAKAKELTKALYNNYKADIMHGVAGQSGDGVIEAVVELREAGDDTVWDIGVDSDQYAVFMANEKEDKAEVILTSSMKKVGKPVYDLVGTILDGKTPVLGNQTYGIAEGASGCADNDYFRSVANADALAIADKITSDVLSGALVVDSAYGMSLEELATLFQATTLNYAAINLG
jgi:basic membrane protein A